MRRPVMTHRAGSLFTKSCSMRHLNDVLDWPDSLSPVLSHLSTGTISHLVISVYKGW